MKIQNADMNSLRTEIRQSLPGAGKARGFSAMLEETLSEMDRNQDRSPEAAKPLTVGTITRETPTISQLLYQSPLKSECWKIIHDPVNRDKAFHKIRPGTRILFDPASNELLWGKDLNAYTAKHATRQTAWSREPQALPEFSQPDRPADLSSAVKNFIGRDYDAMDCYELVVGGLKELGVQYRGKGGLGQHLVNRALAEGLPENHYLNGEGLVSESGQSVFKKTIFRVKDPQAQADTLMDEMKGLLREGQVLSFSMRDKGHTGVVSRAKDLWTFINSGDMDHNIYGENGNKKVGEEDLRSELENWLRLASESSQGLKITLGSLTLDRLSMFRPGRLSRKV